MNVNQKEGERRKSLGFQHPNECIICKPLQERIEPVIISVNENITIHVNNPNQNKSLLDNLDVDCISIILYSLLLKNFFHQL